MTAQQSLFDYAAERARNQPPQPGEIVFGRVGFTDSIQGKLPGGFGEILNAYDGRWLARLEYPTGELGEYYRESRYAPTFDAAIEALYALAMVHGLEPFKISRAVEGYGCPIREGDWYKAACLLRDDGTVITIDGDEVARIWDDAIETLDDRYNAEIARVEREYIKDHVARIHGDDAAPWATWLLGRYLLDAGAPFEWRKTLEVKG